MTDTYEFDARAFADDLLTCGLSGAEIAQRAGCSRMSVSLASCGRAPSVQRYLLLCAAAGLPPAHFADVEDAEPGAYEFDTVALHKATAGQGVAHCNQRARWNKREAQHTHMRTLVQICQFLDVSPVTFFSAAPPR